MIQDYDILSNHGHQLSVVSYYSRLVLNTSVMVSFVELLFGCENPIQTNDAKLIQAFQQGTEIRGIQQLQKEHLHCIIIIDEP